MSGANPLPPHVVHSSSRLTHAQAHFLLDNFLQNAENDAAYRPDSTLTDHGTQSASTGASPNLTLHHLKRILQGIEGKRVGGDNINTLFGELAGANKAQNKKRKTTDLLSSSQADHSSTPKTRQPKTQVVTTNVEQEEVIGEAAGERDGWQDKDDYELAQEESEIDMMDEANPAGVEQPKNEEEAHEEMEVHVTGDTKELTNADKQARKKAKKERNKEEQKRRQKSRAAKAKG